MKPYRRTITLTDELRQQLEQWRDHHPRPYVRERCAAILKVANGWTAHAVARRGLLRPRDPDTVYAWLDRFATEGLAGILGHPQGGYRRGHL
jgi:hypothetical protein